MKRKHSESIQHEIKIPMCQCCLKLIEDETEAHELTEKIIKQFKNFTNLELKNKRGTKKICVTCKKELKYISNLRSFIVKRKNSADVKHSEDKSSFKNSFANLQKKKYQERCRCCFANNKELKSSSLVTSFQFKRLTEIQLTKSDKLCLLCINELNYLERVRKDLLKIHNINQQHEEDVNMRCYYCSKLIKRKKNMLILNDKVKNRFKDFTGVDLPYDDNIEEICVCCKDKLKFLVYFKETLIKNLSDNSDESCQCCSMEFKEDHKRIPATEKIELQFYKITNIKLLKYTIICFVCKLKLDYVVQLQSNLMKNHNVKATDNSSIDVPVKKTMNGTMVSNKRRSITYKSIKEEPVVEKKKSKVDCPHCDKGFDELESLNHHINVAHNDLNAVKCKSCENWYKIKLVHSNKRTSILKEKIKQYVCDHCVNNAYKIAGLYKAKIPKEFKKEITEMKSIKVNKCEICGLVVKAGITLEHHMIHVHSNDRPKQCSKCPSAFKTSTDLGKHVRRVHEQQRNAQCTLCNKKFFGNDGVKLHIQQFHNDERNFKCEGYDECEKAFKNKYKLDQHIRGFHLQERNYPCTICGLGFFSAAIARNHEKSKHQKF